MAIVVVFVGKNPKLIGHSLQIEQMSFEDLFHVKKIC